MTAAQRLGTSGNLLMPWRNLLPMPDAAINASDRIISANLYGAAGAPVEELQLDPPLSSDILAKGILAFGFDRLVSGFASNTVNLKRLSDNAVSDFGFDSAGRFDTATVDTWRSGANVDLVKFYDQKGGAKTLDASGTCAVVRSNVWNRFGVTYSTSDGQLTRSTTEGGVAVNLGAAGHLTVATTGASVSTGRAECHLLWSPNVRKLATNDAVDPVAGGTTTGEVIISYGLTQNARIAFQMTGTTTATTSRVQTSGTDTTTAATNPNSSGTWRWKANAQNVSSFGINGTNLTHYMSGRRGQNTALSANNQTAVAGGTLDNGTIHVGAGFANTSNNTASTSLRGDFLVGGLIVTNNVTDLTDLERWLLQAKLAAVGQQHRIKLQADILAYFDEWVFFKDINAGTGVVESSNGAFELALNTGAGNSWDFAYSIPHIGVTATRSPTADTDNYFFASNTYFAGTTTGTILAIGWNEETNGIPIQNLFSQAGLSTAGTFGSQDPDWSLSIGNDHNNTPGMSTLMADTRITGTNLIGRRRRADDESVFNYDASNQSQGKYNRNTAANIFVADEVHVDGTLTLAWWAGTTGAGTPTYTLDGPVIPTVPENLPSVFRNDGLLLYVGTFEAPVGYNRADSYATRKPLRLQATDKIYISAGAMGPIGNYDGSVAINNYASVCDSDDNAKIRSHHYSQAYRGSRVAFAFKAGAAMTPTQIEEVSVNAYKLVV